MLKVIFDTGIYLQATEEEASGELAALPLCICISLSTSLSLLNFPLGLPSLHATATSRRVWEGQSNPLFRREQNKLWDSHRLCLLYREHASF